MSKKNSNVNLKKGFKDFDDINTVYQKFKNKINNLKRKNFVLAISGGPDSLALAALSKVYSYEKKLKFYYVLVDHKLRKNSSKEAVQVKKLLKKKNIALRILTNKSIIDKNIQAQARIVRYTLLKNFCKKHKIKTILTAHNFEDQVETFLIRLSRGSGLKGLSGMKPLSNIDKKIQLYRPLLDINKKLLIRISKNVFGKFLKDPSNNNSKYLRTKIRNLKKYLINSGIHYEQITKSINNLSSSHDTLEKYYQTTFNKIVKKHKRETLIDLKKFHLLNNEIKIKIINDSVKTLKNNYYNPRAKKVINLLNHFRTQNFTARTLGGCVFFKKADKLCLKLEKKT